METTGNIVTYNLVKFRNVLDLLVSCTVNHRFRFSENGLSVKCVDPAYVFMICMEIPKSSFVAYTIEENLEVGIPTDVILGKLREAFYNDIDLGTTFSLKFETGNDLIYCMTESYTFVVPMLKNIRAAPRVPTIEIPYKFDLATEKLYGAVKLLDNADQILFDGTKLTQKVFRPDFGDIIEQSYELDPCSIVTNVEKGCTNFTREYLIDFLKPLRDVNDIVTVCLGVDYPLIVQTIGDENIKVFLAPRIEHS